MTGLIKIKIEIRFNEIKRFEGNFIVIEKDFEESNIPTHRIRQIKQKGRIIWER